MKWHLSGLKTFGTKMSFLQFKQLQKEGVERLQNVADRKARDIGISHVLYNKINSEYKRLQVNYEDLRMHKTITEPMSSSDIETMGVQLTSVLDSLVDEDFTGTVKDRRLGTVSRDTLCKTCHQTSHTCRGHWGYITLKRPVINPLLVGATIQMLRAVCHTCGELIIHEHILTTTVPYVRLERAAKLGASIRKCRKCGRTNPIINNPPKLLKLIKERDEREADIHNVEDYVALSFPTASTSKTDPGYSMTAEGILDIFARISTNALEDLRFGSTHPTNYIMEHLIVTPLTIRPPTYTNGSYKEDITTRAYDSIIKFNNLISLGDADYRVSNMVYYLILRITNSNVPFLKRFTDLRSVQDLMAGKKGLFRGNVKGKTVNFCSRTVLGPSAESAIGEFMYPYASRSKMSIPNIVTRFNLNKMRELWNNNEVIAITPGNPSHPQYGNHVYVNDYLKLKYQPYVNDVVHRKVDNGDFMFLNRQPTLSYKSFMASRARIDPESKLTVRIPASIGPAYNADYDGDEANTHIPQSDDARAEAMLLSNVRQNVISKANGIPLLTVVGHGLLGLYVGTKYTEFTNEDVEEGLYEFWGGRASFIHGNTEEIKKFDDMKIPSLNNFYERVSKARGYADSRDGIRTSQGLTSSSQGLTSSSQGRSINSQVPIYGNWGTSREASNNLARSLADWDVISPSMPNRGRFIYSCVLPPGFFMQASNLVIHDGLLLSGVLDKDSLTTVAARIASLYGIEVVNNYLTNAQKMGEWFGEVEPVSVSLSDMDPVPYQNYALSNFIKSTGVYERYKYVPDRVMYTVSKAFNEVNGTWDNSMAHDNYEEEGEPAGDIRDYKLWVMQHMTVLRRNIVEFGLNKRFKNNIEEVKVEALNKVNAKIADIIKTSNLTPVGEHEVESKKLSALNVATSVGREVIEYSLDNDNPMNIMRLSGAKGSIENTAQITASIGQVTIDGQRPDYTLYKTDKFPLGTKSLCYFPQREEFQENVEDRGYTIESYYNGIPLEAIFFTLDDAREGLATSKLGTPKTGYMSRQLLKSFEDVTSKYGGYLGNSMKQIVTFGTLGGFELGKTSKSVSLEGGHIRTFFDFRGFAELLNNEN